MKRRVPTLRTDKEAEAFLDSDLSHLDFAQFTSDRLGLQEASPSAKLAGGINATRQRAITRLRRLVLDALGGHDAEVYLFGSHARGEVRHASDIDIAILPREELPPAFFALLADKIEESTIPYYVDLLDLREVSDAFREKVLCSGIKWRG